MTDDRPYPTVDETAKALSCSSAQVARYLRATGRMVEQVHGHHAPDYLRAASEVLEGEPAAGVPQLGHVERL